MVVTWWLGTGGGRGCFGCRHAACVYPCVRKVYNLRECPRSLPWENSASLPCLGWCLGVARPWLTPSLPLACFALLGAAGQGWLGRDGTNTSLVAHSLARPRCTQALWGMGRNLPSSSGISPWRLWVDIWGSSKTFSRCEGRGLVASAAREQQAPAPTACAWVLVCEGCMFLSTSKVQLLLSRGITEPSGSGKWLAMLGKAVGTGEMNVVASIWRNQIYCLHLEALPVL